MNSCIIEHLLYIEYMELEEICIIRTECFKHNVKMRNGKFKICTLNWEMHINRHIIKLRSRHSSIRFLWFNFCHNSQRSVESTRIWEVCRVEQQRLDSAPSFLFQLWCWHPSPWRTIPDMVSYRVPELECLYGNIVWASYWLVLSVEWHDLYTNTV